MLRSGTSIVSKVTSAVVMAVAAAAVVVIAAAESADGNRAAAADQFHHHRPNKREKLHPFVARSAVIIDDQIPIRRRFLPAATTASDLVRSDSGFHRRPQQRNEEPDWSRCLPGIREDVVGANLGNRLSHGYKARIHSSHLNYARLGCACCSN
jgi:hypothetical protein